MVNTFLCPSATRTGTGRDAADPVDPTSTARGQGYGYGDYGPTVYTDIRPTGAAALDSSTYVATPQRDNGYRANGLLKLERDPGSPRPSTAPAIPSLSARTRAATSGSSALHPDRHRARRARATLAARRLPGGGSVFRRFWRWAEARRRLRRLGPAEQQTEGPAKRMRRPVTPRLAPRPEAMAAPTTELFLASTRGGVNCLFGDGSVRFIKDSISVTTLRSLVTLGGGEVVSGRLVLTRRSIGLIWNMRRPAIPARDRGPWFVRYHRRLGLVCNGEPGSGCS